MILASKFKLSLLLFVKKKVAVKIYSRGFVWNKSLGKLASLSFLFLVAAKKEIPEADFHSFSLGCTKLSRWQYKLHQLTQGFSLGRTILEEKKKVNFKKYPYLIVASCF